MDSNAMINDKLAKSYVDLELYLSSKPDFSLKPDLFADMRSSVGYFEIEKQKHFIADVMRPSVVYFRNPDGSLKPEFSYMRHFCNRVKLDWTDWVNWQRGGHWVDQPKSSTSDSFLDLSLRLGSTAERLHFDVPAPANGDVPAPANGNVPAPANGNVPAPANGDVPAPVNGNDAGSPASSLTHEAGSPDSSLTHDYYFLSDAESSNLNPMAPSPLDQFSIHPILDLHIGNYYFSFTNPSLSMLLTLGLVLLLVFVVTKKGGGKSVPNAWQSLVELIYDFVPNLVNEQIGGLSGNVKQKFFPRISVTFTFLLFCNLQGMIPFSFTVTSHFLITLALSFSIFIGITIVGFQRHGLHFFSFLLPAGVPLPLAPFLVLLELISHCFRALSSGIRLFANMMAGHSSVKILSGFAWTMLFLNNIFYFIGDLGPLFIVLALTGLELGVAISQAHVSTISICIYLNDATNLHQNE